MLQKIANYLSDNLITIVSRESPENRKKNIRLST